jgi:hypothetical protein
VNIEIISPTEIHLVPETKLDNAIVRGGNWTASTQDPEPLSLNIAKIILKCESERSPAG